MGGQLLNPYKIRIYGERPTIKLADGIVRPVEMQSAPSEDPVFKQWGIEGALF